MQRQQGLLRRAFCRDASCPGNVRGELCAVPGYNGGGRTPRAEKQESERTQQSQVPKDSPVLDQEA